MNVYLSVDIEGATGLASWSQCGRPDGDHPDFAFARRMLTHDVNAAIRGARRAGADRIVVKDSHGNSKNLLADELEPAVELITGYGGGTDGMMVGIDPSFNASLLIGYHAMAGTARAVMEHTITGSLHRLWIGGQESGEIGLSALAAGAYGVPVAFVSSDQAGCDEAAGLIPGVGTAAVKQGLGRFMARTLGPEETGRLIEDGVCRALTSPLPEPLAIAGSCAVRLEFNRSEQADYAERSMGVVRVDGYSVEAVYPDFASAHRAVWTLLSLGQAGLDAQR